MNVPTKNNWIQSNIRNRLVDKTCNFQVYLTPQKFKILSFYEATKLAALDIANTHDNIFIGLSGGLDSEYLCVLLHELKIPFKPIIVDTVGNKLESEYAYYKCKQLNIDPIVLTCNEEEYLFLFNTHIAQKLASNAVYATPNIITSNYAKKHGGTLIIADHALHEIGEDPTATLVSISDCEFYLHGLTDNPYIIFFDYIPEILYAMVQRFDGSRLQHYKSNLYELPFRPKIQSYFSETFMKHYSEIMRNTSHPQRTHILGNKEQVLQMMDSWNNDLVL